MLVIEDDDATREQIVRHMAAEVFEVDQADGGTTVTTARVDAYDCVILDRHLPAGDGLDWLARWRADGSRVPVIVLTLRRELSERRTGLRAGADEYLTKPPHLAELSAVVRALARRPDRPRPTRVRVGAVELDRARRVVRCDGVVRPLTPTELALVELLFEVPGAVVSSEELFERCWGETANPLSQPVKQHVARLRHKLGKDVIRSVRAQGYALGVPSEG